MAEDGVALEVKDFARVKDLDRYDTQIRDIHQGWVSSIKVREDAMVNETGEQ